jgi:dienelactone hydrolase
MNMRQFPVRAAWAVVLLTACAASADPPRTPQKHIDQAKAMVDALFKEDYAAAGKDFDDAVKKALPEEKLRQLRAGMIAQSGSFQKHIGTRTEYEATTKRDVIYVGCQFEKKALDFRVVIDPEGRIVRLNVVPHFDFQPPPYARPDTYREEEVIVGTGEWALPGTLTLPKGEGPFAAVVLVHGSGANDRDETIGPNKVLRDLAWGLASQGIAVLRYDKRTRHYDVRMKDMDYGIKEEVLDGAQAAVALLRSRKEIDAKRIFVIGHSQGANLGPKIGSLEPGLAGLVLLAGNTSPLEDVLAYQIPYLMSLRGEIGDEEKKQLEEFRKKVARVKDPNLKPDTPREELPLGATATWWLSWRGYDPAATAAGLKMPLLVLQGEGDYQITLKEFEGWKKALGDRKDVKLKTYPKLSHLFMEASDKPTPDDYNKPGHVSKDVVDDIAAWIKSVPRRGE